MTIISVILYEPEIPPNTGNIIRLCANTGAKLHLIKPLGFRWENKALRRAGLDYHEWADVALWDCLTDCLETIKPDQVYAMTTKSQQSFYDVRFDGHCALLFGPETRGLPASVLSELQQCRLPMTHNGRSLNLSNTVAISIYEVWRQFDFQTLS